MATTPEIIIKLNYRGNNDGAVKSQHNLAKYLQYRNDRDDHIPQEKGLERWVDRGLGNNHRSIINKLQAERSHRILAWNLIISPDPAVMAQLPDDAARQAALEHIVVETMDDWFDLMHLPTPNYAYVIHDRNDALGRQQMHAHVMMSPTLSYNQDGSQGRHYNIHRGDIQLLHRIAPEILQAYMERQAELEQQLHPHHDAQREGVGRERENEDE